MTTQQSAPVDTTNKTHVCAVLDRSGSMASTVGGTISGYNEFLNGLRADPATEYTISLIQFDSVVKGAELTISYEDKPLAEISDLTAKDYQPRGSTPLYDAIGECIRRTESKGRAIIVLVITDGQENASIEFTKDSVKALITAKEKEGWTFSFLGANIDSYSVASSIGVNLANVSNYVQGNEQALYSNLAHSTVARSHQVQTLGMAKAASMSFIGEEQRCAMQSPAPGSFTGLTQGITTGGVMPGDPRFPIGGSSSSTAPNPAQLGRKPRGWKCSTPQPAGSSSGA